MSITITTNHRARPMLAWSDIPEGERPELDFGADPDVPGQYFRAYGQWHMLEHFTVIRVGVPERPSAAHWVPEASPLAVWDAINVTSLGTGIVIHTIGEDRVIVGFVITKGI